MNFKTPSSLAACLCALCLPACTLKERRTDCPAFLTVRCEKPFGTGGKALVSIRHAEQGTVFQQLVPCAELEGAGCEIAVPRGTLTVSAIAGYGHMVFDEDIIRAENGRQADSLYAFVQTEEVRGDAGEVCGSPEKEFSTVYLTVIGGQEGQLFILNGIWGQVDIFTLDAAEAPYACPLEGAQAEGSTLYRFRLQRQGDYSLKLKMYDASRQLLQTLPLGEMMRQAWYDARTRPLDDVHVLLDLNKAVIHISVGDWGGSSFPVTGI
ncbi:MAG: hypothetical protein J5871_00395 [Bacteroidales bacterium]|nr:hypothetical protein [Bacteroidales bacterium]